MASTTRKATTPTTNQLEWIYFTDATDRVCRMEGVSDGDSVVTMAATRTRHGRTDTIVVSAPWSRSNRTMDS